MQPRITCVALALAFGTIVGTANEAEMTIACQSIRVLPATGLDLTEFTYTIAYSTDIDVDGAIVSFNDEWSAFGGTIAYETVLQLDNTDLEFGYLGYLELDIPLSADSNLNFITDFFEVDRAVNATTAGTITLEDQTSPVEVIWSREAGQTTGNVRITFSSPSQQIAELSFNSTFEIFQYRGTLSYTPATEIGGAVSASVDLTRVGGDTKFTGPMPMTVADLRALNREGTDWTGPNGEVYSVLGTFDIEDIPFPLNRLSNRPWYAGSFFFLDGVPSTPFQDEYDVWDVFILDPNDTDQDGIPDLTDPGVVTVLPPTLSLALSGPAMQFTITGTPGTTVTLEQKPDLQGGSWNTVQTITLASASEMVTLDPPASGNAFYRVTTP